jgi:hypothetical protein
MRLLAVSSGVAVTYAIGLYLLLGVAPLVVTALKRQWLLLITGWLTVGLVWWIAALRLGRPDSWWARRFYSDDKLARSEARYGTVASEA